MKIFDDIPKYTDEEFQKFYDFSYISEEDRRKLEKIIEFVGVPTQ